MLSSRQNSLIEKVARESGFKDFLVSAEVGSKKGDNYLGNIFLIIIKEKDGSKEKSLILKCALDNEKVRAQIPVVVCYQREVYLYDTVLPELARLQEKHPLPRCFRAFAKMYGFSLEKGNEWLLLENITARGFRMFNRKVAMDGEHVSVVLKELGKLHSLSYVIKHLDPDRYDSLKNSLPDVFREHKQFAMAWIEGIKKKFYNARQAMEGDKTIIEGLQKAEQSMLSLFESIKDDEDSSVITHGDSWCNNMMFKYADITSPASPTELCFLDWQLSKVSSPMYDLCYFLCLSASKEVLDNHQTYLKQYYGTIEENLNAVGLEINSVFPYEAFENSWKKYFKMGLYIVMGMMDTLLKDEKNVQTFSDMAQNGDIINAFLGQDIQNEEAYSRIKNIILMMLENDYL